MNFADFLFNLSFKQKKQRDDDLTSWQGQWWPPRPPSDKSAAAPASSG